MGHLKQKPSNDTEDTGNGKASHLGSGTRLAGLRGLTAGGRLSGGGDDVASRVGSRGNGGTSRVGGRGELGRGIRADRNVRLIPDKRLGVNLQSR